MLWLNIKIALRNIFKYAQLSFFNILGLSIGLACAIITFLYVKNEISYDKFFPEDHKLFLVHEKEGHSEYGDFTVPYRIAPTLFNDFSGVKAFSRLINHSNFNSVFFTFKPENGEIKRFSEYSFYIVDSAFFRLCPFEFVYGDQQTALNDLNAVVLREEISKIYFGDENPIGKSILYNNETELKVAGVVRIPENSSIRFNMVGRLEKFSNKGNAWDSDGWSLILLDEKMEPTHFNSQIHDFYAHYKEDRKEDKLALFPIGDRHLHYGGKEQLVLFTGIGFLILVIACLNFINISISGGLTRGKEFGVKKVHGAGNHHVLLQYIIESGLQIAVASLLALFWVYLLTPVFNTFIDRNLDFFSSESFLFNMMLLGMVAILVVLFTGGYPAYFFSKIKTIKILSAKKVTRQGHGVRNIFITFQFVVSIFLIVAAIVTYKQLQYIQNAEWGLSYEKIIQVPARQALIDRFDAFRLELLKDPNISSVTAASTNPSDIGNDNTVSWTNSEGAHEESFKFTMVKPDFVETFKMHIIEGQTHRPGSRPDLDKYLINESARDVLNFEGSPIGQTIKFWDKEGEIIGVVNDFKNNSFYRKTMPVVINARPDHSFFIKYLFIKLKSYNKQSLAHIEETYLRYAPEAPFEFWHLDDYAENRYLGEKREGQLFGITALIAIFIACMGLFALAFAMSRDRTKEIGIRKVNGARILQILLLLNKDFIKWVTLAFIIASPLAWYVNSKWLENFAYKMELNWWIFALAGLLTLSIALLTVSWQSWRAATRNPVEALRNE